MSHHQYEVGDFTTLSSEEFKKRIKTIDKDAVKQNPEKALLAAGITLINGFTVQVIDKPEEAEKLPDKVLPLIMQNHLSFDELEKVSGGVQQVEIIRI